MTENIFSIGLYYGLYGGVNINYILFKLQYSYTFFVLWILKLSIIIYLY